MNGNSVHTFVSTVELVGLIGKSNYRLLDLRTYSKYVRAHISGSIHIDNNIFVEQNEDGINVIPNCERISSYLASKGINSNDTLILVDDVFNLNCSLAAWTLHYFGFKNVVLVDGAFSKWETEKGDLKSIKVETNTDTYLPKCPECDSLNLKLDSAQGDFLCINCESIVGDSYIDQSGKWSIYLKEQQRNQTERGNFSLNQLDDSILISKDEIMMYLNSDEFIFVDNRSEYAMLLDQQGGNIPRAVHLWYLDLFEEHPDYFIVKKADELTEELEIRGIAKDKTIIVYCESAPQSALVYLVLKELEYPDVRLYLAGYDEWRLNCGFL